MDLILNFFNSVLIIWGWICVIILTIILFNLMLITFKINRLIKDAIGKYDFVSNFIFTPVNMIISFLNSRKKKN